MVGVAYLVLSLGRSISKGYIEDCVRYNIYPKRKTFALRVRRRWNHDLVPTMVAQSRKFHHTDHGSQLDEKW